MKINQISICKKKKIKTRRSPITIKIIFFFCCKKFEFLKNFKLCTSARDICFVSTRVHRETKRYESNLPAVQTKRPGTLGEWTWRFRIEWAPLGDNGPEYVYGITIKRLPTYYSVCLTQ